MQNQPNQERTTSAPAARPEPSESRNLTDRAERAAEQAKSAAIDRVHTVRDQAQNSLDQGRNQVVARIRHVSSALKSAGNELRKDDETVARYVTAASDRIESVASYVSSAEPGRVLGDVQDLAQRKPAWFFGGAFVLGLAAGRFLKASRQNSSFGGSGELDDSDFRPTRPNYRAESRRPQQSHGQRAYGWEEPGIPRPNASQSRPIAPSETVS